MSRASAATDGGSLARINQDLIARLAAHLGISDRAVYPHIQRVANETGLERNLAAILLGMRENLNVNRFSTPDQRNAVSGFLGAGGGQRRREPAAPPPAAAAPARKSAAKKSKRRTTGKTVFVVHGRDMTLRDSMFAFLRAIGLEPLEWEQAIRRARRGANPFVGDVIDEVMDQAQAVLVLFSPDDLVQLKDQFVSRDEKNSEGKPQGQARPNVLFEAGLAMGRHQEKTVLVEVGSVKRFSDIGGRHMLRFNGSAASRHDLVGRLRMLRCDLDVDGRRDWLEVGDFEPTPAKKAKKKAKKRKAN